MEKIEKGEKEGSPHRHRRTCQRKSEDERQSSGLKSAAKSREALLLLFWRFSAASVAPMHRKPPLRTPWNRPFL